VRATKSIQEIASVLVALQWAYLLTTFGYSKWGWWGGVLGLISSPALLPFAPFTAWMHSDGPAVITFYALAGIWLIAVIGQRYLEPRVYDEAGNRVL